MNERVSIYLWRTGFAGRGSDTVVSVAPAEAVISVYGGGGIYDSDGLRTAFDGSVVYCDPDTQSFYLGVWGARNASRFRNAIRQNGAIVDIIREPPPAALAVWGTSIKRSRRQRRANAAHPIAPKDDLP
jgi:hypothetical protein